VRDKKCSKNLMTLKVEFKYFYQAFFMDFEILKSPKSNKRVQNPRVHQTSSSIELFCNVCLAKLSLETYTMPFVAYWVGYLAITISLLPFLKFDSLRVYSMSFDC
jgi:hypothetical protein